MTFVEKFGKISKKLEKADISKFSENFAIQITMDDEDCGGTFFVAYGDGAYSVQPYDYFDNTANINIMSATLEKLIDKKISVDEAFAADTVSVNGNADHIVMLFDAFEKKVRKAPAKKTAPKTEKKAEDKKPAKKAEKKEPAKAEVKKEEAKKPEVKVEVKKEEVKKPEVKVEVKKEEPKKPETKKEPVKKAEPKTKKK